MAELALPSDEKTFDDAQKSQKDIFDRINPPLTLTLTLTLL